MSATTLQRLLKHPHAAVFDKDPLAELVLRVSHAGGSSWVVAAGVLTVVAGGEEFTYQLAGYTVSTLANAMQADGLSVTRVNSQYGHLSALALVEGASDQWLSNGDHLRVFTSLLWALLQGYSREVDAAQEQIRQALLQMVIATAEGEWLDLWGTLYGVPRMTGESDAALRLRIPREAFRLRSNPRAIEAAIKELTGKDVVILEPWRDVFTLDQSVLSGPDKMQDGERVGPFLIQPYSGVPIDWSDVLPIIERNRPAGVLTLPPQVDYRGGVVAPGDALVGTTIKRRHVAAVRTEDLALLDYADIEEVSVLNHPLRHLREISHRGAAAISTATWPPVSWLRQPWDQITYTVSTRNWRSYRLYHLGVEYTSQPWSNQPWMSLPWLDINVVVGTTHSSSS